MSGLIASITTLYFSPTLVVSNVAIPVVLKGADIVPASLKVPSAFCGTNLAVKYFTAVSFDGKATLTLNDALPPVTVPNDTAVPLVVIVATLAPTELIAYAKSNL